MKPERGPVCKGRGPVPGGFYMKDLPVFEGDIDEERLILFSGNQRVSGSIAACRPSHTAPRSHDSSLGRFPRPWRRGDGTKHYYRSLENLPAFGPLPKDQAKKEAEVKRRMAVIRAARDLEVWE